MDTLQFINRSEKFARLLDNVQHPANQNIYIANRMAQGPYQREDGGQKSGQLTAKLI
jgi:hypothetical protein